MSNTKGSDPNFLELPEQGVVEVHISPKTEDTIQGANVVCPKW